MIAYAGGIEGALLQTVRQSHRKGTRIGSAMVCRR